jgi:hypothetical protein
LYYFRHILDNQRFEDRLREGNVRNTWQKLWVDTGYHEIGIVEFLPFLLLGAFEAKSFHLFRNSGFEEGLQNEEYDSARPQRTIEIEVIHAGEVGLSLASDEANTVWFSTVTKLWIVAFQRGESGYEPQGASNLPVVIDIVVERQLFVLFDSTVGKYAHANMASDSPLCNIAVGTAAVVRKPADASSLGCINEVRNWDAQLARVVLKCVQMHIPQHHEIKIMNPLRGVVAHTFLE